MSLQEAYQKGIESFTEKQYSQAIAVSEDALKSVNLHDYMLISKKPKTPKALVVEVLYNVGVFYKTLAQSDVSHKFTERQRGVCTSQNRLTESERQPFDKSIEYFRKTLSIQPEHKASIENIISVHTILSLFSDEQSQRARLLQESLFYNAAEPLVHYNLGLVYQKLNKLENSIIHYKLAISLLKNKDSSIEDEKLCVNCLYGMSGVYMSIKEWNYALYFLLQALRIRKNDPDVNNHLGTVYTELRRTDLAKQAYTVALENVSGTFISKNSQKLLSNIYLNMGHMHGYNGDTKTALECYDRSLVYDSKNVLAFQNKVMNLNYHTHELPDSKYIYDQHAMINSYYNSEDTPSMQHLSLDKLDCLTIGFVSADFVDHPVSHFINPILNQLRGNEKYKVVCYSNSILSVSSRDNISVKVIKGMSADDVCDLIKRDGVDILFDLSGHTSGNRLDVFAQKPAPIQITYIGYPNTTGLKAMDYRIVDRYCDIPNDHYYGSEKLITLPSCFLCYSPDMSNLPDLTTNQPFKENKSITFGCFNRLNKITTEVVDVWNGLLKSLPTSRILFKTKALLNPVVRKQFLEQFGENAHRILIRDCTNTHEEHLSCYNDIDIAIDTFPYCGTTTTCEALMMGVPVLTLCDSTKSSHAQNVSTSILCNSDLGGYVCDSKNELINKAKKLQNEEETFWTLLKQDVRQRFINGRVCSSQQFIESFESMLQNIALSHQH